MCLTSYAVYRIRDADAIFRIQRKDDQKIAKNSKLFYTKYREFTSNHCGSVHGALWRIVLKYILFFCACFSRFTVGSSKTRQITIWALGLITTDHDMRPIGLNTFLCFVCYVLALPQIHLLHFGNIIRLCQLVPQYIFNLKTNAYCAVKIRTKSYYFTSEWLI